jgi:hypothetical protein
MQRTIIKKCFLFTVGSDNYVKRFVLGGKRFADDEDDETEVWSGWDNSQKTSVLRVSTHWRSDGVSVSMLVEKQMFFPGSNITCFTFYIQLWPIYWLFLLQIQLTLWLIVRHITKAYGGVKIAFHTFLTSALDGNTCSAGSSFGMSPRPPPTRCVVKPQSQCRHCEEKNCLLLPGIESCYIRSLVTIPTVLENGR